MTAVDDMAWAFVAARRWFHLPDQVECVHADARAYLGTTTRRWSGIALDVFRGVEIPHQFMTAALVARAMRQIGLVPQLIQAADDEWSNTVVVCHFPRQTDPSLGAAS